MTSQPGVNAAMLFFTACTSSHSNPRQRTTYTHAFHDNVRYNIFFPLVWVLLGMTSAITGFHPKVDFSPVDTAG